MAEHVGKPKVRFAGFTEAWEQRKLGEIADIVGGGTPSTSNPSYWNGDIDWYAPAEIGEQIFLTGSQKKITANGLQKCSAALLPVGTVLFTSRAGIGNTAILAKQAATNQGFQSIVPDFKIADSYFIFSRTHELKKFAEIVGAGSTFTEVSGKQMSRMPILMPKLDEQARIGTFFRHLDRLITLHQRKRERLENIKKAMLEKMFPKNGADVPEVRFAGFTEAWEQRKAIYLGRFSKGSGYSKADLVPNGIPIILYGQLYTNYQFAISEVNTYVLRKKNSILSKGNEVIIPASGETAEDIARASSIKKRGIILGGDLNIIEPIPSVNSEFLALSISNGYPHRILAQKAQGKSVVHIHNSDIQDVPIAYPSREEQSRIAEFFRHLDRLVTLHQRKVELLQNIKKACLEAMFA
ncbi:MAG: restriction endonuclease subunit S [Desulfovibrio sp.]